MSVASPFLPLTAKAASFNLPHSFNSPRLIPPQVMQAFRQIGHSLRHTLTIVSPELSRAARPHTRIIPSAWGVRQDAYRWKRGHRNDVARFREIAASVARVLAHQPIAAWADLLPGTMHESIGNASDLYLADYWTLTLHHLVWSGRLPYAVQARWERGDSAGDDPICFVSELPTDLAEASCEALILLEEAAARAITSAASFVEQFTSSLDLHPRGLPIFQDGQWTLPNRDETAPNVVARAGEADVAPGRAPETNAACMATESQDDAVEIGHVEGERTSRVQEIHNTASQPESVWDDALPLLDEQTFGVRFGGRSYRFTPRNKQLFALLERVTRRPGHRVLYNDLRSIGDVWDGALVEDSTIRGAVARLRKLLSTQGIPALARRIVTGTYRGNGYVLLRIGDADDAE